MAIQMTGGDRTVEVTDAGGVVWVVHEFTQSGQIEVVKGSGTAELLVVAGGGGGGAFNTGGGGGAGGVLQTSIVDPATGLYNITVGAGGAGKPRSGGYAAGDNGENSVALGYTAIGGGGGGGGGSVPPGDGGSGGGGGGTWSAPQDPPGGAGTTGQGHAGGAGWNTAYTCSLTGGGGGGAGSAGTNGSAGGHGGDGISVDWDGTVRWFGGGGGGGTNCSGTPAGGVGGGGDGSGSNYNGQDGQPNTGGGGGGVHENGGVAGDGGSGIVLIRYLKPIAPDALEPGITGQTDTTVTLEWTAQVEIIAITSYNLEARSGSTVYDSYSGLDLSATLAGIPSGAVIDIVAWATNADGDGPITTTRVTMPPDDVPQSAPGATVSMVGARGTEAIRAEWPTFVPNADDYIARLKTPAGDVALEQVVTSFAAEFTSGFDAASRYTVTVAARNAHGEGPADEWEIETSWIAPGDNVVLDLPDPKIGDAIIGSPDATQGIKGTVKDLAGDAMQGAKVRIYRRDTGEWIAEVESDATGAWQWTGAIAGLEYYVVAINPAPDATDYAPPTANRLSPVTIA